MIASAFRKSFETPSLGLLQGGRGKGWRKEWRKKEKNKALKSARNINTTEGGRKKF